MSNSNVFTMFALATSSKFCSQSIHKGTQNKQCPRISTTRKSRAVWRCNQGDTVLFIKFFD